MTMGDQDTLRLRATLTVRNDHMIAARERFGLSQVELAETTGIPLSDIGSFEKMAYRDIYGDISAKAKRLAIALDVPFEQIFPPGLAGKNLPSKAVRVEEVAIGNILEYRPALELPAPEPDELCGEKTEAVEILKHAMQTLCDREREILEYVYGLKDGRTYNYVEIGQKFNLTRERVRQIEAKALKRLVRCDLRLASLALMDPSWEKRRDEEIERLKSKAKYCRESQVRSCGWERGLCQALRELEFIRELRETRPVSQTEGIEAGSLRTEKKRKALQDAAPLLERASKDNRHDPA